jgi:hypothetical protein
MEISNKLYTRLAAQAVEAKELSLNKVASNLERVLKDATPRTSMTNFYSKAELEADVEGLLWKAAANVSDYLDASPDAESIQALVDVYAKQLFNDLRVLSGSKDGVGAFEPLMPGEVVSDND